MLPRSIYSLVLFSFRNVEPAHYALKYNLMPYVGALTYGEAARTNASVVFPPLQEVV
jgi:signal peptidase complex subunit 3